MTAKDYRLIARALNGALKHTSNPHERTGILSAAYRLADECRAENP